MNEIRQQIIDAEKDEIPQLLSMLISNRNYCLSEVDLDAIDSKFSDEIISGWIFTYKVYNSSKSQRINMLRVNLNHPNPRIREQVCDIIGDEFIAELRDDLKQLFEDQDNCVSEAAKYNHNEMFRA